MWEHRVIKGGHLGIPNDKNLISCPPLSRNEPANDMRLCFTRCSFGVWDRHSAPQSSPPIDHSPETRNLATSLNYTQI